MGAQTVELEQAIMDQLGEAAPGYGRGKGKGKGWAKVLNSRPAPPRRQLHVPFLSGVQSPIWRLTVNS